MAKAKTAVGTKFFNEGTQNQQIYKTSGEMVKHLQQTIY